jgi:hypothetical protein
MLKKTLLIGQKYSLTGTRLCNKPDIQNDVDKQENLRTDHIKLMRLFGLIVFYQLQRVSCSCDNCKNKK